MVRLSLEQAKKILERPLNGGQLQRARKLERRIQLHAQPEVETDRMQNKHVEFSSFVSSFLPPDKMEGFLALWQAPSETNEVVDGIFAQLKKVFHAENRQIKHNFKDSTYKEDFHELCELLQDAYFWENDYWEELKTNPNSYIVIDLPAVQVTSKPEPYYYIVKNCDIIDVDVDKFGDVQYIAFWTDKDGIVCVSDSFNWNLFQVPLSEQGTYELNKAVLISSVSHNLGKTPATPLYYNPINKEDRIINANPITKSLSSLDWLLFFEISTKYLELYAPFPIYATYAEAEDSDQVVINGGEDLRSGVEHLIPEGATIYPTIEHSNNNRKNRKLIGAGTVQRYKAPLDKEDFDMMQNPVQVIPAEKVSLEYCQMKLKTARENIYGNCVGKGSDVLENQAVNEDQVHGSFETKQAVLENIRVKIQSTMKYVYSCVAMLRYDDKIYLGSDVFLGDKYFMKSPKEQKEDIKTAKDSGLPVYEVNNMLKGYYKSKYQDNPYIYERNEILSQLEPYPGLTLVELSGLSNSGWIDSNKMILKINFDSFISRFEREQLNIVDFGSLLPIQTKIKLIQTKLQEYVAEEQVQQELSV